MFNKNKILMIQNEVLMHKKKNILLTGNPKVGKTAVIKKLIGSLPHAGGFYTEAIYENNKRTGFKIITLDKKEIVLAHEKLKTGYKVSKYSVDIKALEDMAVPSILECLDDKTKDMIIIDEIGKMEVLSLKFQDMVVKALDSAKNIIGVVTMSDLPFVNGLRQRHDVEMVEVTTENRDTMPDKLKEMIDKIS
jgi:nucleoside-triphosphatase